MIKFDPFKPRSVKQILKHKLKKYFESKLRQTRKIGKICVSCCAATEGAQGGNRTMVQLSFWAPIFSPPKTFRQKSFIQKNTALGQNLDVFNYLNNLISEICGLSQRWYVFVQKGYPQRNNNDILAPVAIWNRCHEKVRKYRMEGLSKAKNQH